MGILRAILSTDVSQHKKFNPKHETKGDQIGENLGIVDNKEDFEMFYQSWSAQKDATSHVLCLFQSFNLYIASWRSAIYLYYGYLPEKEIHVGVLWLVEYYVICILR